MNMIAPRPVLQKPEKAKKDPAHMAKVRLLPCVICEHFGDGPQLSPTEAHHPIHGRYGTQKVSDKKCIPLCCEHHRHSKGRKLAIHDNKKAWLSIYGADTDYVSGTLDQVEGMGL